MRHAWCPVVLVGLVAACSGGSDAAPLTTVPVSDPPVVSESVVTDPPETSPTSSVVPTTIDEEDSEIAAVEQAAVDAYNAYHAAILDPSNPDLRTEVERTHSGGALDGVAEILDNLVTLNQVARPHAELTPTVEIVGAVRFTLDDNSRADLLICELNPERFVEVGAAPDGSDALVRDDVFTVQGVLELKLADGAWTFSGGDTISVEVGEVECP